MNLYYIIKTESFGRVDGQIVTWGTRHVYFKFILMTKLFLNLKKVLNGVISEFQGVIISGMLILDNIMISYEVMHYMKR